MEDKMAAGAIGRARNYGWDGLWRNNQTMFSAFPWIQFHRSQINLLITNPARPVQDDISLYFGSWFLVQQSWGTSIFLQAKIGRQQNICNYHDISGFVISISRMRIRFWLPTMGHIARWEDLHARHESWAGISGVRYMSREEKYSDETLLYFSLLFRILNTFWNVQSHFFIEICKWNVTPSLACR